MPDSFNKSDRLKELENGKGIPYLLEKAYEILGNPILIHNMEYKAIEYNRHVITDDPIWNEYAETGTVDHKWLEFFKNECFLEAAANAKKITYLSSDKLKYIRIYGKLFNKNSIQIGCAVMVACDKPFDDEDPILFEEVCDILSAELGNQEYFNEYGQAYFEKLLEELINGVSDIALYTAHVESIYMHLKNKLYLAVVDTGLIDPDYSQIAYYRDMCKKIQPEHAYAIYSNHIIIIIGIDDKNIDRGMIHLNRFFRDNNFKKGISSPFENLFEMNVHYKEALVKLSHEQKLQSRGNPI